MPVPATLGGALLLALTLAGCAASGPTRAAGSGSVSPPHVRCLNEPGAGPDRPLFFLFCVQSP